MKSVLLIGLGRFGRHIAKKLYSLGHEVMAVDSNEERVDSILPFVTNAQIGDSTSQEFLSSLGVRNFDACIVAIGTTSKTPWRRPTCSRSWGHERSLPAPPAGCRKSSCCATGRTRSYIPKSRWPGNLCIAQASLAWKSLYSPG